MSKIQKHLGDFPKFMKKMTLKLLYKPNKMYRKRKENILKIQQMRKKTMVSIFFALTY